MAKATRIYLNIGMVDAMKKMLRKDNCPRCGQEIGLHRWIEVNQVTRDVRLCSWLDK